jgi:hypothetical protein
MANDKKFGFNDGVDPKDGERIMLPKGLASFAVIKIAKKHETFNGIEGVDVAYLDLEVSPLAEEHSHLTAEIQVKLPMLYDWLWKYLAFFSSIGQRKHGDKGMFKADWKAAESGTGTCLVGPRSYVSKKEKAAAEAEKRQPRPMILNDVEKFLSPDEVIEYMNATATASIRADDV